MIKTLRICISKKVLSISVFSVMNLLHFERHELVAMAYIHVAKRDVFH